MDSFRAVQTHKASIPSTGRTPQFLAKQYGYDSAKQFADAIPESAIVIDVGAGVSRLGHYVARWRPDVKWVNADLAYANPAVLEEASRSVPKNLKFVCGDVIAFSPELHAYQGKAHRVYSYWMMPHLSLSNVMLAEKAAGTMWELLNAQGQLAIGPIRSGWWYYKHSLQFSKRTPKAEVARVVARATKLHWLPRKVQALGNKYNVHVGNHILAAIHWWQARRSSDRAE
ncbi:MAG TPA: class I SAM-dependent methyltransferase [Candidatus Saccharimonadales bacterium]|nr:class I SAM-dependent methyltransferase [Candidatus Saccharimonadales bacterium]